MHNNRLVINKDEMNKSIMKMNLNKGRTNQ